MYALGNPLRCVLPICFFPGAYYAAQIGISLKAVNTPNRTFLAALLTALENLRSAVGPSDAVTVDSASSAYVENFALRVFASADTEDRRGAATRKTAKKFLAAATFFDVLNVFDDSGPWETVSLAFSESFIFREADLAVPPLPLPLPLPPLPSLWLLLDFRQHEEKARYAKWRAAEISRALREGRQPTPVSSTGGETAAETAAIESTTPAPPPIPPAPVLTDVPSADISHEQEELFSTSVPPLVSTTFGEVSTAFGEGETPFETFEIPPVSAPVASDDPQAQHTLLTGSPETPQPTIFLHDSPAVDMEQVRDRSTSISAAPLAPSSPTLAQRSTSPTRFASPDSPPSTSSFLMGDPYPSAPPLPSPPPAPYVQIPPPAPSLLDTSPPPELTPGLIAKTQKHCRFAISALDYEDAEQARKELRAALAILGG